MSTILRRDDFVTPGWTDELSDTWGATSLHGAVFRRPRGFKWVHCDKCRSLSSPSGMRSLVLPARGKVQMTVVCETTQAMLRHEATQAVTVPEWKLTTKASIREPILYD